MDYSRPAPRKGLGFRVLGFRVLGFRVLGYLHHSDKSWFDLYLCRQVSWFLGLHL